jgi:hypothetical protein
VFGAASFRRRRHQALASLERERDEICLVPLADLPSSFETRLNCGERKPSAGFAKAECEISELPRAESGGRGRGFAARSMRKHQKKARPTTSKIKEGPQRPGSRSFFRRRRRRSWFVVLRWIQESRAHEWPFLGNRTRPVEISIWASERTKGAGETGALEKPRAEEESAPGKKKARLQLAASFSLSRSCSRHPLSALKPRFLLRRMKDGCRFHCTTVRKGGVWRLGRESLDKTERHQLLDVDVAAVAVSPFVVLSFVVLIPYLRQHRHRQ